MESNCPWQPYADPDRPGVVRVPVVTQKHEGMEVIIDASDLPLLQGNRVNWSPGKGGKAITGGSAVLVKNGSPKPLARIIMGISDPEQLVSHLSGDRLDCRRENLVVRTRSEVALARKPSPEMISRLAPYPDPDRPGVWRVPLKSYLANREVIIDEADLPIVKGRNWNFSRRSDDSRMDGCVVLATTGRQLPLHRIIANVTDPKLRVWFVNGDALDCRRANLSVLTMTETARNTRKASTRAGRKCTSTFKGVCLDPDRGKWVAQIRKGAVGMGLGRFETEIDAAIAYDAAARVLFGEHGHLNFPDRPSTEQAMAEARIAIDSNSNRMRAERRRQRDIEGDLRRSAAEARTTPDATQSDKPAGGEAVRISGDTARQLFDVTPTVWQRWQKLGWVAGATADDAQSSFPIVEIERLLRQCGIVALPYPDPQRPGVYRVPLSGETALGREALIDVDAVPLVQTRRWRFAATDSGRGGEVQTMIPSENIRLHYVVMGMTGDAHNFHIGHRNDDPLDCRRENLVVRTLSDTHGNHRKQATFCGRPCTSRFKGVYRERRSGRWVATIKKDGIQRRLGIFRDEIAAAQAYDEAARELFGEHARPNFPGGVDAWTEREAA